MRDDERPATDEPDDDDAQPDRAAPAATGERETPQEPRKQPGSLTGVVEPL